MKFIKFDNIWTLILCYLIAIFLFAALYSFLPHGSFYHPTVKYDIKYFNHDAKKVIAELNDILSTQIKVNIEYQKANIELSDFNVFNINIEEYPESVSIFYSVEFKYPKQDSKQNTYSFSDYIQLEIKSYFSVNNDYYVYQIKNTNKKFINDYILPMVNYYSLFSDPETNKLQDYLKLNENIYQKIVNIGNAYEGFPDQLHGHFIRMLYFSTGIATTITFGDITPITDLAKIMVIIQNIFTLIFIALLIDYIVDSVKKKVLT